MGRMTHGQTGTKIRCAWKNMVQRCNNPKNISYPRYGARGIRVCKRWSKFKAFYEDMPPRPEGGTLERIDNNKGYSPGNCRWATRREQGRNRRDNRMITHRGQTKCLTEWAEGAGLGHGALHYRINAGWSMKRALATPSQRGRLITVNDMDLTMAEWSRRLGGTGACVHSRLRCGWSEEDAVLTPLGNPRGTR